METKEKLPNSTAVLVLGICSIVLGCFFIGLILGIIGLVLSGKDNQMYKSNPELYDGYCALNAGRIMSIIGIVFGALYTIYYIVIVVIFSSAAYSLYW